MGDLNLKIDGDAAGLWGVLDRSRKKATAWASGIASDVKSKIGGAFGAIGAGISVAGAIAGVKKIIDTMDNLQESAQRSGIDAAGLIDYQGLIAEAEKAGASAGNVEAAFRKMSTVISDAMGGNATAAATLAKLGLSLDDVKNKSQTERFAAIAGALGLITDEADRAAIAQDIFGKGGTALIPILSTYKEAAEHLKEVGGAFTAEDLDNAGKFNDAIADISKNIQGMVVGSGLVGWLADVASGMKDAATNPAKAKAAGATGKYADAKTNAVGFALDYVTLGYGSDAATNAAAKVKGKPIKQLNIAQTDEEKEKEKTYYVNKAKTVAGKDVDNIEDAKKALADYSEQGKDKGGVNTATSTAKTRKTDDKKAADDKRKALADKQAKAAKDLALSKEDTDVSKLLNDNEIIQKPVSKKAAKSSTSDELDKYKSGLTVKEKEGKSKSAKLRYDTDTTANQAALDGDTGKLDKDMSEGKITREERDQKRGMAFDEFKERKGQIEEAARMETYAIQLAPVITNADKIEDLLTKAGVKKERVLKLKTEYEDAKTPEEKKSVLTKVQAAVTSGKQEQDTAKKNKTDAKDDFSKRLQGLKQEAAYQELLNQGKEREVAIQKEIDEAKEAAKAKGQSLTEGQEKQLRKAAGNNYDAANPWQGIEGRNINISNNAMSRVGGGDGTKASGWASGQNKIASASEKAAAAAEKTVKLLERIESKSGKSGGMVWP